MASRPRTANHRRRQRQRDPSISSQDSISSDGDSRPLTTPRTKRRSITNLHELVKRQKEELERRHVATDATITPQDIELKMESLLSPSQAQPPEKADERRVIQVAVRCRPRRSSRMRGRGSVAADDNEEEFSSDDDSDFSSESERVPHDSVAHYDLPESPRTRLPALSVPSHVLALGGYGPRRRFEFDRVFPPWKQQRDVYDAVASEAVDEVLRVAQQHESGAIAHATVVAYGQTGTGKTYTMGMLQHGDPNVDEREHGLIPRAMHHILSRLDAYNQGENPSTRLVASMSFLQIYLEAIQDLLATPSRSTGTTNGNLQVRLDPSTSEFHVPGLSEFPIADISDARELLELAAHNRVLAATARNKTSSRSHTLLTIRITRQARDTDDSEAEAACTVSFVDLAGSERVEGALHFLHATRKRQELRIREAKFINRSLSALGSVISALSAQDERRGKPIYRRSRSVGGKPGSPKSPVRSSTPHIRFRDSQLTKLLQSRLMNGNGRLVLIATIDDRPANLTETLSTLKFASQCRRVELSQTQSKTEAARKQREETLLKQVFAEVKTMYEEREAALHKQYEARIEALDGRIRALQRTNGPGPSSMSTAAYVALCSLVDVAQRHQNLPVSEHPMLESFAEESDVVTYVADLYRRLKDHILAGGEDGSSVNDSANESRQRSMCRQSRVVVNDTSVVDAPPPSVVIEPDATPPKQPMVAKETEISPVNEVRSAVTATATSTTATATTTIPPTTTDSEFQALARFMFTSGMLHSYAISSDDDDDGEYSQI